ncbi:FKBP-type peptidyl-prolyl cis-trans isomerase [Candidatus Woesearchaeota archaeon]|nr:FKBP-type peptidyl-prolyl cis-trans isomerase [Candidatus Woesearchaeota archaeon]
MESKESESTQPVKGGKEILAHFKSICKFLGKHALLITLILAIGLQFVPNGEGTFPWGGIYMRMQAQDLPIADQWAEQSILQGIKSQVTSSVNQEYPNLPDANKKTLVDEKVAEFKKDAAKEIATQTKTTSEQIKDHFMYEENGKKFVYMPDIDTYYYLRGARNLLEKGHTYDELKNGIPWDNHVIAPLGRETSASLAPSYMYVYIFKVFKIFSPSINLMDAANYFPIIFMLLALFPAFFLGRKLAGNLGGFFSVTMVAILPAIMARTPWGHADTDAYNIFFPLLITWLVVEMVYAKGWKNKSIFCGLAALSMGLYSIFWGTWQFIFYFNICALIALGGATYANSVLSNKWKLALACLVIIGIFCSFGNNMLWPAIFYLAAVLVLVAATVKALLAKKLGSAFSKVKPTLYQILALVVATVIAIFIFHGRKAFNVISITILKATSIQTLKQAAHSSLWPNVYTTVAELNPGSFNTIIGSLGGKVFFFLALLGVFLLITQNSKRKFWYGAAFLVWFFITISTQSVAIFIAGLALLGLSLIFEKTDYAKVFGGVLMLIWFGGTVYASLKGIRFTLLAGPAFAIAFASAIGLITSKLSNWADKQIHINKIISTTLIIALVGLMLMNPVSGKGLVKESYIRATSDVPLVNDAWWNVLTKIKEDSPPNAIINSWWDFGHHFKYIADRAVTFDGGSQNSPMAHWIGRTLQTDNEKEAVGILRMLDCGSNTAYEKILNETGDIHESISIIKQIILLDKSNASKVLSGKGLNPDEILPLTHCDPPEDYFIVSADMTGKAGVWSHFGLWDFDKADIWKNYRKMPKETAVEKMTEKFGYSENKAEDLYDEVQALGSEKEANSWISPWPSFQGNPAACKAAKGQLICNNIYINASTLKADIVLPQGRGVAYSVAVPTGDGFKEIVQEKFSAKVSVLLVPREGGKYQAILVDPLLAKSMYTRLFYLDGHSTTCFEKFTNAQQIVSGPIFVWKVDWTCGQDNKLNVLEPKSEVAEGNTVAVNYIGYLDNGTVFDSSLPDWQNENISQDSEFSADFKTLSFIAGSGQMIKGVDKAVIGMKQGEVKTIRISPEDAYGTDPKKHPLGNKTLNFKLRVVSIH